MEFTEPMNGVEGNLNFVCLRWATEDEINYTLNYIEENRIEGIIETGQWFKIVQFDTIVVLNV